MLGSRGYLVLGSADLAGRPMHKPAFLQRTAADQLFSIFELQNCIAERTRLATGLCNASRLCEGLQRRSGGCQLRPDLRERLAATWSRLHYIDGFLKGILTVTPIHNKWGWAHTFKTQKLKRKNPFRFGKLAWAGFGLKPLPNQGREYCQALESHALVQADGIDVGRSDGQADRFSFHPH